MANLRVTYTLKNEAPHERVIECYDIRDGVPTGITLMMDDSGLNFRFVPYANVRGEIRVEPGE